MAKPENPLNKFNTYSYHHVLMVTNNTNVIEHISSPTFPVSAIYKKRSGTSRFELNKKQIIAKGGDDLVVDVPRGQSGPNEFVTILDGTSDAEVYIESVSWDSIFTPRANSDNILTYTSMGIEGSMRVVEPKGARFFNVLQESMDLLGCDVASAIFVLKTIFVGRTQDGVEDTIAYIQPFAFTLIDVQAEFSAGGTEYDLTVVGINNGTSKLPQFYRGIESGAQSVPCYTPNHLREPNYTGSTEQSTLEQGMKDLFKVINDAYNVYWQRLERESRAQATSYVSAPPSIKENYRLLTYEVVLDRVYKNPEYKLDQFKEMSGEDTDQGTMTLNPGDSIEDAIHRMMQLCSKVRDDAIQPSEREREQDNAYVYKILTTVQSTTSESGLPVDAELDAVGSDKAYKIIYKIQRYAANSTSPRAFYGDDGDFTPAPGNVLELDYLFTGKNVDIMDMNMKLDAGYLMFFAMSNNNSIPSAQQQKQASIPGNGSFAAGNQEFDPYNTRKNKVLPPGLVINDPKANHVSDTVKEAKFRSVLNNISGLSALDTKITIRGHLSLLTDTTLTPQQLLRARRNYVEVNSGDELSVNVDWQTRPGLVKINIKMPSGNSDNPYDFEPFWYQGYYQIISIKHIFEDGEFKQELDLLAMRVEPQLGNTSTDTAVDVANDVLQTALNLSGGFTN